MEGGRIICEGASDGDRYQENFLTQSTESFAFDRQHTNEKIERTETIGKVHVSLDDEDIRTHDGILSEMFLAVRESAQTHLRQIKGTLLEERYFMQKQFELRHSSEMEEQSGIINTLRDRLSALGEQGKAEVRHRDQVIENISMLFRQHYEIFVRKESMVRIIHLWRYVITKQRKEKSMLLLVAATIRKAKIRNTFAFMRSQFHTSRADRMNMEWQERLEMTTKVIVEDYEKRCLLLRTELAEAHRAVHEEQTKRHQLEEDLRRLFLKNMSTMNLEALSLFQPPTALPNKTAVAGNTALSSDYWTSSSVGREAMNILGLDGQRKGLDSLSFSLSKSSASVSSAPTPARKSPSNMQSGGSALNDQQSQISHRHFNDRQSSTTRQQRSTYQILVQNRNPPVGGDEDELISFSRGIKTSTYAPVGGGGGRLYEMGAGQSSGVSASELALAAFPPRPHPLPKHPLG